MSNINKAYYIWPTFTLGGYYGFNKNLVDDSNPTVAAVFGDRSWQSNWQVRIAATYRWGSLLPVDSKKARARENDLAVKQAEDELKNLRRLIQISIKASYYKLFSSHQKILSHRESIGAATEGLRIAKESYRAGIIKNTDLMAAQLELTKARMGYINSVNHYYLSIAELKREIGTENEEIIFKGKMP